MRIVNVVAAVMEAGGRILLARRADHGLWEFPGGKVAPGESPAEALRRELREEFGIDAVIGPRLGLTEHPQGDRTIRLIFLRVEAYTGTIELRDHTHMAWVPVPDLPTYDLMPADVAFARALADGEPRVTPDVVPEA